MSQLLVFFFFLHLSDRMAAEPQTSASVSPSTQILLQHSWLHTPWCWLGTGASPAMQVQPHSATVQSQTGHRTNGLGEQQGLEKENIYFLSLWLSEVQFK